MADKITLRDKLLSLATGWWREAADQAAEATTQALDQFQGLAREMPIAEVPAAVPQPSSNPGHLTLHTHIPQGLPAGAPLVVLLHGCGQEPQSFARETGWRSLADRHGLALLMPGQTEANNSQTCFNWFRPGDTARGQGEAGSIAAMTEAVITAHRCDRRRVFATGLSAGGAMTASLLAAYPDVFAAGAVVAGLPAGAANNVMSAMSRMAGRGGERSRSEWLGLARALAPSGFTGPWPRLSIWHGSADNVVAPSNGLDLARQFASLHGVIQSISRPRFARGVQHTVWNANDHPVVELWQLDGVGHLYPTPDQCGISAAEHILTFWGLTP